MGSTRRLCAGSGENETQTKKECSATYEYEEEILEIFLKMQGQLFDEPVAETLEEADEFLDDCMAAVVDSVAEVREYFE